MVSTYHGIETGRRAITYYRKGMEIAGVNTSNAGVKGYSRQVVNAAATDGLITGSPNTNRLGTGVEITGIERMRDSFLDARIRRASVEQVYWQTMVTGMERVDSLLINVNEVGINTLFDNFWTALQEVQKNPSESPIRSAFMESADTLTMFAQNLYGSYNSYRDELNNDIRDMVEDTNLLIDEIAILNKAIWTVRQSGTEPNELLDRRDLLVDQLSQLTGAVAGTSTDEMDGDFKISLNGRLIVQGENVRHLVLVPNPANNGYYEVQIENNQYDITSDPDVVQVIIERRADDTRPVGSCTTDGTHEMDVKRLADELFWTVGYGGGRIDGINDPSKELGLEGSFALQVGSNGVRAYSEVFSASPPGLGVVLGEPGPDEPKKYSFRVAAGEFESTITMTWDDTAGWTITDSMGSKPESFKPDLTVENLGMFMDSNYAAHGISVDFSDNTLVVESTDRHVLSITDMEGSLMSSCGLSNDNPIVLIDISKDDTLQTIANKINNAYKFDQMEVVEEVEDGVDEDGKPIKTTTSERNLFYETVPPDTAPSSPEEWMHASVEIDENGDYYLCLASNVAGEANRINVMPGSVCGGTTYDMNVARALGLVSGVRDADTKEIIANETSYIQLDRENDRIITSETEGGKVHVYDAYIVMDGVEYLSSSNAFKDARKIASVGNAKADTLVEFSPGIRVFLQDVGSSTITVRHPLTEGAIFASIKLRDDVLLSQMDIFDDMMYKLATEFNAVHYAGYGSDGGIYGDYSNTTGIAFFGAMTGSYGAFGKLKVDDIVSGNHYMFAAGSGDGKGKPLGTASGTNALAMAQLKQAKLFIGGTGNFDDLYKHFVAEMGSLGERSKNMVKSQGYVIDQIEVERSKIMGVSSNEEMYSLIDLNQRFNNSSQYISTLFQVIDQIIAGVGRVGI